MLVYVRRRLAMCARKLGRVKEAVKMMRDVRYDIYDIRCSNFLMYILIPVEWQGHTHRNMYSFNLHFTQ